MEQAIWFSMRQRGLDEAPDPRDNMLANDFLFEDEDVIAEQDDSSDDEEEIAEQENPDYEDAYDSMLEPDELDEPLKSTIEE
ncbi:unnamed protein product [Oikopleura dioica]|uniref:Uncharacterized protein n=1 Tax=Oikopleura dioica TaxID=34765 RepID=E4WTW6_OIKDI|nr:unnamed protein product [Oikopleura dioica]